MSQTSLITCSTRYLWVVDKLPEIDKSISKSEYRQMRLKEPAPYLPIRPPFWRALSWAFRYALLSRPCSPLRRALSKTNPKFAKIYRNIPKNIINYTKIYIPKICPFFKIYHFGWCAKIFLPAQKISNISYPNGLLLVSKTKLAMTISSIWKKSSIFFVAITSI